jgi:uncharacterized membrane protein YgcG
MKKALFAVSLLFTFAITLPAAHAQTNSSSNSSGESINNYVVSLDLGANGALHVNEDITYNFGPNQRHGIFRFIPLSSSGWPKISANINNVTDPANNDTYYGFSTDESSGELQVQIGDPNVLLTGVNEYAINYDVTNVARSFSDHDELYWNAIGTEWPVAIGQASVMVTLPASIPSSSVSTYCYTGVQNSTAQDCAISTNASGTITVVASHPLPAKNGLTISVSVPKGYLSGTVQKTIASEAAGYLSSDVLSTVVPVGVILLIIFSLIIRVVWARKKRVSIPKELKHVPIAPYYNPPDNLPPVLIGYAENRSFDAADFTSIILDLAVKGFLKIKYLPHGGLLGGHDYELTALKPYDSSLPSGYQPAYDLFFAEGATTAQLSATDRSLGVVMFKKASTLIGATFDQAGYAIQPKMGNVNLAWPLIVLFIGIPLGIISPLITMTAFVICFGSYFVMATKYQQKFTPQGIDLMRKVLGYKMFLTFTAEERLKRMDAPKLSPQEFEKTLPYAIALGIEKEWAKQFESLTIPAPQWIDDARYQSGFSASTFISSFGSFTSTMNSSVLSRGGGSGAGGGGSSGGGGGGGGGGSW